MECVDCLKNKPSYNIYSRKSKNTSLVEFKEAVRNFANKPFADNINLNAVALSNSPHRPEDHWPSHRFGASN